MPSLFPCVQLSEQKSYCVSVSWERHTFMATCQVCVPLRCLQFFFVCAFIAIFKTWTSKTSVLAISAPLNRLNCEKKFLLVVRGHRDHCWVTTLSPDLLRRVLDFSKALVWVTAHVKRGVLPSLQMHADLMVWIFTKWENNMQTKMW